MPTLAERARRLNRRPGRLRGPAIALLSDDSRLPDPRPSLPLLRRGDLVVLRNYEDPERVRLARDLARLCRARGLVLVVAGDFNLMTRVRAHGLHLPEWQARLPQARVRLWHRRAGRRWLSAAAHSRQAVVRAASLGADAAFVSPVFPTASHADAKWIGLPRFRMLCRSARLPVWALGGVTAASALALAGSGAVGIATVGGLGEKKGRPKPPFRNDDRSTGLRS